MPFILPANTLSAGGYDVDNSLRFNSASADSLTRAASGNGTSNQKFTMSLWVKKSSNDSAARRLIELYNTLSYYISLRFRDDASNRLDFYSESNGGSVNLRTNRAFRDTSAWYHIVLAVDTTDSTANDRMKMYINGVQETSFASRTNPGLNENLNFNNSGDNQLISISQSASNTENDRKFNGYMSEICFIDGLALDPTSFGEFDGDSGIWKPIDVSGLTFGNNGFYLETKQSGTSQNSSGLGADTSGNDNHFAVNNLTAVDQSTDTCTNNFATMNLLDSVNVTLSEGNLSASCASSSGVRSTIAVADGKFYAEVKFQNTTSVCGVAAMEQPVSTFNGIGAVLFGQSGAAPELFLNGGTPSTYANAGNFAANDIMQIALDMDNSRVYFGKNGSWFGGTSWTESTPTTAHTLTSGYTYGFVARTGSGTSVNIWNFGSPSFAISSGNTDPNGYGNFEFPTNGYYALNTKNLAEFG